MKKLSSYSVYAKLTLEVSVSIKAESLADAVVQARELKELDFVDVLGEFCDGSLKVTGVLEG
jgi:hypothetical protein